MSASLPSQVTYGRLGNSGLKVSNVILGCMSYGNTGWAPWIIEDEEEVIKHISTAWEAGINTFDTANVYSNGASEELLGKALKALSIPRSEVVILTKTFFTVSKEPGVHPHDLPDPNTSRDYVNNHGLSRKALFESVAASLKRLDVEYIDVLQCHRFDYETPIEETMDALHDLVKSGVVRYIGMSSCWAHQFAAMQNYAKSKNQTMFVSMQNFYNALYREEEREMLPTCKQYGVGAIPYSPLAKGNLARPWTETSRRSTTDRVQATQFGNIIPEHKAINEAVERVAKARGYSMAQVAVAWLLSHETVSAPIVGSTNVESIKELASATHIKLTDEEIKSISEPYKTRAIMGHA